MGLAAGAGCPPVRALSTQGWGRLSDRGRRRATREQRLREVPWRKLPGLLDLSGAEEMGAAPQPLPFLCSFPFPTNGLGFHFLPFRASSPRKVHFLSALVAAKVLQELVSTLRSCVWTERGHVPKVARSVFGLVLANEHKVAPTPSVSLW